jgi:hypothetical protein
MSVLFLISAIVLLFLLGAVAVVWIDKKEKR